MKANWQDVTNVVERIFVEGVSTPSVSLGILFIVLIANHGEYETHLKKQLKS